MPLSEHENLDIGKVVGLIMENPQLIEQISNLAKQQSPPAEKTRESPPKTEESTTDEAVTASTPPTYPISDYARGNRAQLLGALKPYVSEERAKAIDSMISIADIIDMMRSR